MFFKIIPNIGYYGYFTEQNSECFSPSTDCTFNSMAAGHSLEIDFKETFSKIKNAGSVSSISAIKNIFFDDGDSSKGYFLTGVHGYNGSGSIDIQKFYSNGRADPSFNNFFGAGAGHSDVIQDIIKLNNGNYLIGGLLAYYNGVTIKGLAMIDSEGNLIDSSNNIVTSTPIWLGNGMIYSFLKESNGDIIAVGDFGSIVNKTNNTTSNCRNMFKINNDGTLPVDGNNNPLCSIDLLALDTTLDNSASYKLFGIKEDPNDANAFYVFGQLYSSSITTNSIRRIIKNQNGYSLDTNFKNNINSENLFKGRILSISSTFDRNLIVYVRQGDDPLVGAYTDGFVIINNDSSSQNFGKKITSFIVNNPSNAIVPSSFFVYNTNSESNIFFSQEGVIRKYIYNGSSIVPDSNFNLSCVYGNGNIPTIYKIIKKNELEFWGLGDASDVAPNSTTKSINECNGTKTTYGIVKFNPNSGNVIVNNYHPGFGSNRASTYPMTIEINHIDLLPNNDVIVGGNFNLYNNNVQIGGALLDQNGNIKSGLNFPVSLANQSVVFVKKIIRQN